MLAAEAAALPMLHYSTCHCMQHSLVCNYVTVIYIIVSRRQHHACGKVDECDLLVSDEQADRACSFQANGSLSLMISHDHRSTQHLGQLEWLLLISLRPQDLRVPNMLHDVHIHSTSSTKYMQDICSV